VLWTRSTHRGPIPPIFQLKNNSKNLENSLVLVILHKHP
jgi:hypothetical protein